jgi:phosphoribosylformylglycinamidine synthase
MDEQSPDRRPAVQVANPFLEKLLCEACLQLNELDGVVAIQDLGAAGLTGAACELAHRGGRGVELDVARVSRRARGMTPYEVMLSESQERMLVVAKADRVPEVQAIAAKWELDATPIGRVTDDGMYRCTWGDHVVVEIPGRQLVEGCPVYYPEAKEDPAIARLREATPSNTAPTAPSTALLALLDHPSIASKRWVFEQYDSTVQASTVVAPGGDAGVLRVRHTDFAIAVTTDCNSRYVMLDPYEGGKAAVAEAARNVACTGARPLGITDCLNFGSPERPAVFYQFKEACRGIADACRALGTPVTGGNVSFYNESPTGAVDPTPVVGMVGLLARADRAVPSHARVAGDAVFVLGDTRAELGGSACWEVLHGLVGGQPPHVDLDVARRLVDLLVAGAERGLFRSAHDCSQGGLGVALAEVAMGGPYQEAGFGMDIDLTTYDTRLTTPELLFSESHGRAVVTCAPERVPAVEALAREFGVPLQRAGAVGPAGGTFRIAVRDGAVDTIEEPVARLREVYFNAIPRRMGD